MKKVPVCNENSSSGVAVMKSRGWRVICVSLASVCGRRFFLEEPPHLWRANA
jgi:hypothetical protein